MSAHRTLKDLFHAYTPDIGPGVYKDPGDAGTITPATWGQVCSVTTTGGSETRTLSAPDRSGLMFTIVHDTDGGDFDLTVTSGYNRDGDTAINFADEKDYVVFLSIKAGTSYYWRAIRQEGTDAAVEDLTVDTLTATTLGATTLTATTATITNPLHVVTEVTAVGSVLSLATNSLAPGFNVVTGGGSNLGLKLPVAATGLEVIVKNASGSTAKVYTTVGSVLINELGAATGFDVADTKTTRLICQSTAGPWWTDPLAVA